MSVKPNGKDSSERGPGWYDVAAQMRYMEKHYGKYVHILTRVTTGRNGSWGLHVMAYLLDGPLKKGHGSYGTAFPGNGQRTVAAAYFRALVNLDEELCKGWLDGEQAGLPLKID